MTPVATCSSSGNGDARREATTTVVVGGEEIPLDIPDDDNDQEVPLKDFEKNAPSCSWAADGSDDSHSESVKPSRKRKNTSGAAATGQLMVSWLDGYKQEKRKTEEEKIKKVETMHNEKMSLLLKRLDKHSEEKLNLSIQFQLFVHCVGSFRYLATLT